MLIIDILNIILLALIGVAIVVLNVILTKEAVTRNMTFSEIIEENQDTSIGKIFMSIVSFPTYIALKIITSKEV